jgi:hypothetical protein
MKPIWLIEADVFGVAADSLKAEIRRQGMAYHVVRQSQLFRGPVSLIEGRPLADDACVIFYGSYPMMRHIQLHRSWVPGGWCAADNLDCSSYYPHYNRFLLNQRHVILPGTEAIARRDELFERFSVGGEVFVRPNGMHKLFTGRCVSAGAFAEAIAPSRYDPATKVVVAQPRPVDREWRLVITEGRPTAASQYAVKGIKAFSAGCPDQVRELADRVLAEVGWRPDVVFMADVCESNGELALVEFNSFSCSGLYHCDPQSVVAAVSETAVRVWEMRFTRP